MRTIIALALAVSTAACIPDLDDGAAVEAAAPAEAIDLAADEDALSAAEASDLLASLAIGVSVNTRFDRRYVWDMTVDNPPPVVLAPNGMARVSFPLHIRNTGVVASGHRAEGVIRISNPGPRRQVLTGVFAIVGEVVAPVTCAQPFPATLPPATVLGCTYRVDLPSGRDRTLLAVAYGSDVAVTTAPVRFTSPSTVIQDYDRVVEATAPGVGHVYLTDARFEPSVDTSFSREIGPFPCGPFAFEAFAFLRALSGAGSIPSGQVQISRSATASGTVACLSP